MRVGPVFGRPAIAIRRHIRRRSRTGAKKRSRIRFSCHAAVICLIVPPPIALAHVPQPLIEVLIFPGQARNVERRRRQPPRGAIALQGVELVRRVARRKLADPVDVAARAPDARRPRTRRRPAPLPPWPRRCATTRRRQAATKMTVAVPSAKPNSTPHTSAVRLRKTSCISPTRYGMNHCSHSSSVPTMKPQRSGSTMVEPSPARRHTR